MFGSLNPGYRASHSNDESMVVVRGHAALAEAYAFHVLDVYDHDRFRAATAERKAGARRDEMGSSTPTIAGRTIPAA